MAERIVHVIDGLGSGGAEALLVTNLRAFRRFEHTVVTVLAEHGPMYPTDHFWAKEITGLGVRIIDLGCRTRADVLAAVPVLARKLRGVSVVHTHLRWAGIVGRAAGRLAGAAVVSSLHQLSYEPEVLAGYRAPKSKKHDVMRALEAVSLRQAHAIVAVGESVRASAIQRLRVPARRLRVIYNPVDFVTADAQAGPSRAELLRELGIQGDPPLLLNVGRLVPQKNQTQLVRELAAIDGAHLAIIGAHTDDAYVREVRAAAAAARVSERVHLVGVRRDIPSWLRAADAFVFPSTYEGLAVALIEASGAGCTCVASDIAPNREVLTHERTGLLAPIQTPGAFGNEVKRVLADRLLAQRLAAAAKAHVRQRFDPETSVRQLTELYDELIANSKA